MCKNSTQQVVPTHCCVFLCFRFVGAGISHFTLEVVHFSSVSRSSISPRRSILSRQFLPCPLRHNNHHSKVQVVVVFLGEVVSNAGSTHSFDITRSIVTPPIILLTILPGIGTTVPRYQSGNLPRSAQNILRRLLENEALRRVQPRAAKGEI